MKRLLLTIAALLLATPVYAQQVTRICFTTNGTNCIPVDASNPFPVNATVSATVTFPTIGAAVPATGTYTGVNVGGTLRGLSGLSTGSLFTAAVAIVVGSGNQVTTFGSSLSYATSTLTGWTSATAANTTQLLMPISGVYGAAVLVQLDQTTTISAGAITFEGTYDGTNWVTIPVAQVLNPNTFANLTNPYTLVASTNQSFLLLPQGYQSLRIKLSTQITGSATVTPFVTLLPFLPVDPALLQPLASGVNIVGKFGVDQTTPGTTNAVQSIAGTTGGATVSSAIAPATPAGVNLKASAGTVYSIYATTIQSTPVYVKFYNSASAPTCGSGTPVARFMVPAASTAANGAGTNITIPDVGVAFGTGIGYCITGALADNDTTAITASNTLVNIVWK